MYMVGFNGPDGSGTVSFPQLLDVATQEDAPFPDVWLAAKDGTLWHMDRGPIPPSFAGQEASPGTVTGLAVSLDDAAWVVTDQRQIWHRRADGFWSQIAVPHGIEPIVDVTIHHSHL